MLFRKLCHPTFLLALAGFALAAGVPALSGAPAVFGAGTYPRATRLQDGSLLGGYTSFTGTAPVTNIINVVRSTDDGATWAHWGEVTRGVGDIDNPFPLQLPSGRVLMAFRNHSKDQSGVYTFFRITICASDDNGASWHYLSQPASDPGSVNGNWEPFLRLSNAGVLQLYYSRENSGSDQDSLMRTSPDQGSTWTSAATISGADVTARDGMLGVTNTGGSTLLAVFESKDTAPGGTGLFTVNAVTSPDDGQTWGGRRRVYTPAGAPGAATNAGAPQIAQVGSALVVSFMTDEDTVAQQWPNQAAAKIVTSTDGGNTWANKLTFGPVQSFWPGLLDLDSSSVLGLVDNNGAKAQKIVLQ